MLFSFTLIPQRILNASLANIKVGLPVAFVMLTASPCKATVSFGTPPIAVSSSNQDYLNFVRHMTVPIASQTGATWADGNDVTGKTPAEIQNIVNAIKALETSSQQKQIFTQMNISTEAFDFTDVAHARGRVVQRLKTIQKMQEFNAGGGVSTPYFYGSATTNAPHWLKGRPRVTDAAGRDWNHAAYFRQKSGTAYQAITSLCSQPYRTRGECLGAAIACVWWGAAQSMGESRFNALYPGTTALDMDSDFSDSWKQNLEDTIDVARTVPGDWVYWQNHDYGTIVDNQSHFDKGYLSGTYLWRGENAFYLGRDAANVPKYEGLGLVNISNTGIRLEMQIKYNTQFFKLIQARIIPEMDDATRDREIILIGQKRLTF